MSGLTNLEFAALLLRRLNELTPAGGIDGRFLADVLGILVANAADGLNDRQPEVLQQFVATVAHEALQNIAAIKSGEYKEIRMNIQ